MENNHRRRTNRKGFTLIELLVVIMILGFLTAISLPAYFSSVQNSREETANANARAIASAVQSKAISSGSFDTNVADYAQDMGGVLPGNPCSGTGTGYTITVSGNTASVSADSGSGCGTWIPQVFNLTI